jgi:hypothetical protein
LDNDIEEALSRVRATGRVIDLGESQSDDAIQAIEARLAVELPDDYKQFIREYGFLMIADVAVTGVVTADPLTDETGNTVAETLRARELGLPTQLIVVRADEEGYPLCIDASGAVITYAIGRGKITPSYRSFRDFLLEGVINVFGD